MPTEIHAAGALGAVSDGLAAALAEWAGITPTQVEEAVADYLTLNPPAGVVDATTGAKGVVQLAGDLGGTAASPTVPGLAGKVGKGDLTGNPSDTIALIGTSITSQNLFPTAVPGGAGHLGYQIIDPSSSVPLLDPSGYWHWAATMSGHRLTLVANKGVGGNTTTQMRARFDADILALSPLPGWLLIEPGPNDAGVGVSATTTIDNLTDMITRARTAGIRVILATVTISSNWSAAGKAARSAVNAWIKQTAASLFPGLVVVDWAAPLVDSAGAALAAAFRLEPDGTTRVHPTPYGAALMGGILARALNEATPAIDRLATDPADPLNLLPNPFNTGTGTVANLANVSPIAGGSITGTTSLVDRTDDIPGKWQRITITAGDARMRGDNTDLTKWSPGNYVYGHVEFRTDPANWTGVRLISVGVEMIDAGGFTLATVWGLPNRSGDPENPYNPGSGVLFLPPALIPTSTTRLRFGVYIRLAAGGGNATLDIGRREFRIL